MPEDVWQGLGLGRVHRAERQEAPQFRWDHGLDRLVLGRRLAISQVVLPDSVERVPRGDRGTAGHFGQRSPVREIQPANAAAGDQAETTLSARDRRDGLVLQEVPDPPYLRAGAFELLLEYRELIILGEQHAQVRAGRSLGQPLAGLGDLEPAQSGRLAGDTGRLHGAQGHWEKGTRPGCLRTDPFCRLMTMQRGGFDRFAA